MKKKIIMAVSALTCAAMLLGGCGGGAVKTGENPTIKIFIVDRAEAPISKEMPVVKALEEKCNVNIEFELAPSTDASERFNLVMASNDIPDLVIYHPDDLLKYTKAFEPLEDLMNQYGPNVKEAIDSDASVKKDITAIDGKIYTIPEIAAEKVSQVYFVRKDWLDKLNIKSPETTEDFYQMLKAFKEKDPNGNGQQDEIPYVTRNKTSGLMPLVEAFGITYDFFEENGEVKYGAVDPRMKEALAYLHKLYSEGLIDQEYLTVDSKAWQSEVTSEKAGCMFDWVSRIDFFNEAMSTVNKSAKFEAILPPTNGTSHGISYQMRKARDDGSAAISKNSKHKKEIMEMYNYIFSDEGTMLLNFGIESEHYSVKDGIPTHNDELMHSNDGSSAQTNLWKQGINLDWPCKQDINHEMQLVSDTANAAREMYDSYINDPFPKLRFTDEERTKTTTTMSDIKTFRDESIDNFITGSMSLDEFDAYTQKIHSMGIDSVLEIYNTALKRYNEQ